ncbi:hypothetical protein E3P89_02097 [Wallemia ichthyophaga]|uniref:hydroxyacylglutathione hydrolase n=1 Tax=Wallemia ichthyophaga TaxID=245174 RepID=A0A4T0HIR3_WALIC|nr:hypothetical protein E3P98_00744 [Wallemia ichthyophaga]TIB03122.1 hypothetical protein E3P95_00718 [Wallemia ichthyophaga]TIB03949.1 hypothetical protein E3P94_00850 [Wallemia ichthyophaga]TIB14021.1 hypothetical protein E3P90_01420 [Wallemia ichthyophaga]TIB15926.1 hypothetical protein E3P93_01171 [Wallemia ichthyophaga]
MRIVPVPNQSDNYAYLIIDEAGKKAASVDPYAVDKVLAAAKAEGVELAANISTHHHNDHTGGNMELHKQLPNIPFYSGSQKAPATTNIVSHGDEFKFGSLDVSCHSTPCHTQDSTAFLVHDKSTGQKAVFTGDTLFTAGCGRFFEGTAAEMHKSLNEVLAKLPSDTVVYNGHEYTRGNVKFALTVEPKNEALRKLAEDTAANSQTVGKYTIGDELAHNPFMRVHVSEVQEATGEKEGAKVMAKLREMKNKAHPHPNFRRSKQSNTIQDGKGSENKAAEKHPPPPPPPRRTFSDKNPFSNLLQSSKPHLPPRQSAPDTQTETASTSTRNQNDVSWFKPPPRPPAKPRLVGLQESRRPNLMQRSRSLQISASEIRSLFGGEQGDDRNGGNEESEEAWLLRNNTINSSNSNNSNNSNNYTALP